MKHGQFDQYENSFINMKHILLLLFLVGAIMTATGQNVSPDSINARVLEDVVVVADNQRIEHSAAIYIPNRHQKNAAQNAVSLLGLMSIPQLDVDLSSLSVKTIAGQSISIYIDFNEATTQDLDGIKTQDVKRVEFYDYPTDPRFKGAHHVVNFVMQKYEYGGYTKLKAEKLFCVNQTVASLYSKMAYKNMTYDIYADENYLTDSHSGNVDKELFLFPDYKGAGPINITRNSATESSKYKKNVNNASFRALYSSSNIQISNRINFNTANIPTNESTNSVTYKPSIIESGKSQQISSAKNITATYNGDYFFRFSPKTSLQAVISYDYGHNTSGNSYFAVPDITITNNAKEESHGVHFNPRLSYRINDKNNVMLYGSTVWQYNKINYSGNSPSIQKYNIFAYFIGAHYDLALETIQAGGEIGWAWERNKISGTSIANTFPQINIYANYMPKQKHLLTFSWNFGKDVPDVSQKSPNMLQQDELMWYTGSPDLKDYKYMNSTLTYTWLPNNKWQLSASGGMYGFQDRCVAIYSPTAPDGMMLRKYVNGGDYKAYMINVNATVKLFNGRLVMTALPQFWHYRTTGAYSQSINDLNGRIQVSYYLNNLFIVGSYALKRRHPATQAEYVEKIPEQYMLQVGWGNGKWNINVTAYNFLRSSWVGAVRTLESQYYNYTRKEYSTAAHMRFSISATYTIGYGKKVDRYNEVGKGEFSKSAILK